MILTPADSVQARFLKHVRDAGECWLWTASKDKDGYGLFWMKRPVRFRRAHRLAYQWWSGPIPAGLSVLHRCNTPSCVNPCHLYVGTHYDNMQDRKLAGHYCFDHAKKNPARGSRNAFAKLKESDIPEIRRSTLPQKETARRYGVTPGVISHIMTGRTWRHVE